MDGKIEVKVFGSLIDTDNKYAGTQYESNATKMRIEFDGSWDGYTKTVTFWNALRKNPVNVSLTLDKLEDINESKRIYIFSIPGEALEEAGEFPFVVEGYIEGSIKRSVECTLYTRKSPRAKEPTEPSDPTPTQAEQLQTQIDTFIDTIQKHAQTASAGAKTAIEYSNYAAEDAEQAQKSAKEARNNADEASKFADEARESAEQAGENAKVSHINQGEGERSLVFNDEESNRALAPDSISAGTDTISGCKGYYISAIDFENKKIYLSETLVSLPTTGAGEVDLTFATPAYEVGNDIGIMFSSHRLYFATIASVENNVVTYNGDLGFDASNLKEDADGYEFFVPQHPEIGSSVFTQTSFGFGEMIRAIGRCCALFGRELFGGNYTGLFGRNNKASTYSIGGGYGTISHATHAFFSGVSHILKGYCVGAIGAYLKVSGTCTFVTGDKCEFNSSYSSGHGVGLKCNTNMQHLVGRYNEEDEDAAFVVGIGANESLRKNGLVAKKDGSATVSKQGTSDDSVVQKKYVDDAFTTKATPLQTVLNKIEALFHFGTGFNSIMLGGGTEASGAYSGSWGLLAKAKGYVALALGYDTKAEGVMTLAANRGTIAKMDNSTALGMYNEPNYTDLFQIGNGSSDTDRKNAFSVHKDGHAEVQTQGDTENSVVQKKYVDELLKLINLKKGEVYIKGKTTSGWTSVRGFGDGGIVEVYTSAGNGNLRLMEPNIYTDITLCDGENLLRGKARGLSLQSVGPAEVVIKDGYFTDTFDANYCNLDIVFPPTPCMKTITMEGTRYVSNPVVDLSAQTALRALNIAGMNATIIPPDLSEMTFEDDTGLRYVTIDTPDVELLKKLLPTRSEAYPGRLETYGDESLVGAEFLAERHWQVMP